MRLTILSLCLLALITGCGIKPHDVEPPPEVKKDTFPRTYPNPNTDPHP